jgi:methionyl-tRNA synthetase
MKNKFYITTSIPYANAKPHMGHTLDALYADVLKRHYKAKGYDALLQVGLDENGQKIFQMACENKMSVDTWLEKIRPEFLNFEKAMNIDYDIYTRTSDTENHHVASMEIWKKAEKSGDIYKKAYEGMYCVGCEEFKKDADLVDGKCPDHLTKPELIREENYFFKLSKYEKFLKEHFDKNPDFVYPQKRFNEAYQMITSGLEDVSISRPKERLPWGVSVPGDNSHVMYVWFDALVNYITAIGFPKDEEKFKRYWPADLEIVGLGNNRWHSILWVAMLKSAGLELPKKIMVHSYIMGSGGVKMSKTIGNVIDPLEVIGKYGVDSFRYFLLSRISIVNDGIFDMNIFESVYQADLANDLGNLLQRVVTMLNRYSIKVDKKISGIIDSEIGDKIESLKFDQALASIWVNIRALNQQIEIDKPWELAKFDLVKLSTILVGYHEELSGIANNLKPFMPETSDKIKKQLQTLRAEQLFPRIEKK